MILPTAPPPPTAPDRGEPIFLALLALLAALVLRWRWVGYQGTDDVYYVWSAIEWANNPPHVGETHWSLRYPLVLAMAGAVALFGLLPFAFALPNLIAYLGFLALTYVAVRHWFGWRPATLAALGVITLPIFPVQATYPNPDLLECALAMAALWCFLRARQISGARNGGGVAHLALAGALAGLAFLTREISVALVFTLGILFLVRPRMARWRYFIMGGGFLAVVTTQLAWFAWATGNPFYRYQIASEFQMGSVDRAGLTEFAQGRTLDLEGVLATSAWLKPFTTVLISQKFGILFFLALPATWLLLRSPRLNSAQRDIIGVMALLAVVSWLFISLNTATLVLIPRYFAITAAAVLVIVAVALDLAWRAGRRYLSTGLAIGLFGGGSALLYLEFTEPTRAEQDIVARVAQAEQIIHLDPHTASRALLFLRAFKLDHRVSNAPPPPGALVIRRVGSVEACQTNPQCGWRDRGIPFLVRPDWQLLHQDPPERRLIGTALRIVRLDDYLPPDILAKIERPYLGIAIYRVPG